MAILLCLFSEDRPKCASLRHSALSTGEFDGVVVYDLTHPLLRALKAKASDALRFEWKFWRPYVIDFTLHNARDGDVVVFVDRPVKFVASIQDLLPLLGNKDVALFESPYALQQRVQCTQDCFKAMRCTAAKYKDAFQVDANVQVYRKSPTSVKFVKEYVEFCSQPEVMDTASRQPNDPEFLKHGHDQSVLTNLAVKHKAIVGIHSIAKALALWEDATAVPCTMVVTATVGTSYLPRCLDSVQVQTLPGVEHVVVVDGPQHADTVYDMVDAHRLRHPIHVMVLPFNVGHSGWCGHRVYASVPFLLDADYVAFLDEDNFVDADHYEQLQKRVLADSLNWSFSLRKIVDTHGDFVALDNCESLGNFCHSVMGWNDVLVDTSCYYLTTDVARAVAQQWMHQTRSTTGVEADRSVTTFLLRHPTFKGAGVPRHSLNYVVGRSASSVTAKFFVDGNQVLRYDFAARPTVYVFHFNAEKTQQFLLSMYKDDRSYALDEWQMTLLRGLRHTFNLVNGYAMQPFLPSGALVYVSMCHLNDLPIETLKRTDITRILYTIESPNIRHQQQWSAEFLSNFFDHVLTYWESLLQAHPEWTTFCPHNTHHLDFDNAHDLALLHTPSRPVNRDVVMVLERRDLKGEYSINGVKLTCLDPLRQTYVEDLSDITVYGIGWGHFKKNPRLKVGHTKHRSLDDRTTVDILKDYTFVLIVENTTAEGYVSEKIYDAFVAGCIPLYYGNNNDRVGIPRDMYIDISNFPTSAALQEHLDSLSLEDIAALRRVVLEKREAVLHNVSTQAFAETFEKVIVRRAGA